MESSTYDQPTTDAMSRLITSDMTTSSSEDDTAHAKRLYNAINFLFTYVYAIIVFIGVIGNIFCMVILTRPKIRHTSVSLYLFILALTDNLVLILDFFNNFFAGVLNRHIIGISKVTCNLYMFFFNVAFTYSSWLVVAITFERTLAVCLPLKSVMILSRKKAKIICAVILFIVAGFLSFNLLAWNSPTGTTRCGWAEGWEDFHQNTNMWLMGFSYSYVPSLILLVCNTLIVYQLAKASKARKAMQHGPETEGSKSDTTKITITVLSVSVAFLLLTAPLSAYYLVQFSVGQDIDMTPEMALGEAVLLMLGLANHGINFWIYIVTSVQYRRVFVGLWCLCVKTKGNNSNQYATNTNSTTLNAREASVSDSRKTLGHSIQTVS